MVPYLARLLSLIVMTLPLRVSYTVGAVISELAFFALREKRRNAIENMAYVLGPAASRNEVVRSARRAMRNYARYLVDFLRMPSVTLDEVRQRVEFDGWHYLDAALEHGKGAIFCSVHMGSWDLGAGALALAGYPVNAVVDTFKHPHLNEFIQNSRRHTGMNVIPVNEAPRRVLKVLRQNEVLGLLVDRPTPNEGVPVSFFGAEAWLPAGAAALSLRTGARVLTMGLVRRPDNSFVGLIHPPIEYQPTGDREQDIQALTQRIVASLEEMIRAYPDQWFMFRRMWGTSPQHTIAPALPTSEDAQVYAEETGLVPPALAGETASGAFTS
jgi:KDO2-lipid IV(A) lauroyltransferase